MTKYEYKINIATQRYIPPGILVLEIFVVVFFPGFLKVCD